MGNKSIVPEFKNIISKVDADRPKLKEIDWSIQTRILNNTDFTKTKNTMEAMNLFYEQLWMHVIFPLEDEIYSKNREIGRILGEWIEYKKKAEKYKEELDTLRERLQEEGEKEAG